MNSVNGVSLNSLHLEFSQLRKLSFCSRLFDGWSRSFRLICMPDHLLIDQSTLGLVPGLSLNSVRETSNACELSPSSIRKMIREAAMYSHPLSGKVIAPQPWRCTWSTLMASVSSSLSITV